MLIEQIEQNLILMSNLIESAIQCDSNDNKQESFDYMAIAASIVETLLDHLKKIKNDNVGANQRLDRAYTNLLNNLSRIARFYHENNIYISAANTCELILLLSEEMEVNNDFLAAINTNAGYSYLKLGNGQQALQYLQRAKEIYEIEFSLGEDIPQEAYQSLDKKIQELEHSLSMQLKQDVIFDRPIQPAVESHQKNNRNDVIGIKRVAEEAITPRENKKIKLNLIESEAPIYHEISAQFHELNKVVNEFLNEKDEIVRKEKANYIGFSLAEINQTIQVIQNSIGEAEIQRILANRQSHLCLFEAPKFYKNEKSIREIIDYHKITAQFYENINRYNEARQSYKAAVKILQNLTGNYREEIAELKTKNDELKQIIPRVVHIPSEEEELEMMVKSVKAEYGIDIRALNVASARTAFYQPSRQDPNRTSLTPVTDSETTNSNVKKR